MMTRRKLREQLYCMLFQINFHEEEEIAEQLDFYLSGEDVEEEDRIYLMKSLKSIQVNLETIDSCITTNSEGWKIGRMNKADLTVLRLAVYEMQYDEEVPEKVAINEAVELAKLFGGDQSPSFVNGMLGKIERNGNNHGE